MKNTLFLILFLFSQIIFANEVGYFFQGKKYLVYKEGKKIGEWPKANQATTSQNRNPASIKLNNDLYLEYQEDDLARCYFGGLNTSNYPIDGKFQLSCVKK